MRLKRSIAMFGVSILALPAAALGCEPPAPAPAGLTITPSITCREGHLAEFIRLSKAQGDPVDSVFALCRDPARDAGAWAASLERTRDKLTAKMGDAVAKAAIRAAFDRHITSEPDIERSRIMARLNYVELPVSDIAAAKSFYEAAFGWTLTSFGPTYAATLTGDTDIGLQGDPAEASKAPLPVIEVEDLEEALEAVTAAGGTIVRPIFAFPGGRRFQFLDPGGNEVAAVRSDPH